MKNSVGDGNLREAAITSERLVLPAMWLLVFLILTHRHVRSRNVGEI